MRIIPILICLSLSACVATPEPEAPAAATQAPEKKQNMEMRDAIQAPIDKAKEVQDQVDEGAEKQRDAIEAAGG